MSILILLRYRPNEYVESENASFDDFGLAMVPVEEDSIYKNVLSQAPAYFGLDSRSSHHNFVRRAFFEFGPNIIGFSGNQVNLLRNWRVGMTVLEATQLALMGFRGVGDNPASFR